MGLVATKLRVVESASASESVESRDADAPLRVAPAPTAPRGSPERDAQLVMRARAGDERAWGRLYQDHFDRTYRYAVYLVGDADLAEDITQETFARALVSLAKYRGDAKVSTWLNCISVNIAREHWRKQKRKHRIRDAVARVTRDGTDPEHLHEGYLDGVRSEVLYAVLDELPVHLREAFVVRDLMGLDGSEAAAQLGISAGNVAVRAHRARARVRTALERLGWLNPCASKSEDSP